MSLGLGKNNIASRLALGGSLGGLGIILVGGLGVVIVWMDWWVILDGVQVSLVPFMWWCGAFNWLRLSLKWPRLPWFFMHWLYILFGLLSQTPQKSYV